MAENKKHHYVPKLYLKLFSVNNDDKNIGLYHLPNDIFRATVPLKSQAYEDYFYGEDSSMEKDLGLLEGFAAPSLKKIIERNLLPKFSEHDYHNVFVFTMITANRTKDVVEEMNESTHKIAQLMVEHDEEMSKMLDGEYQVRMDNAAALSIKITAKSIRVLLDLKMKLLINKTDVKFITSDNPVIKYNQFLEKRNYPYGSTGFASKGLQVIFPISPSHCLIYYDELVYKIGDKNQNVIDITNANDVESLNNLQVLNCLDHLYFNQQVSERYIKQLCEKMISKRNVEYTNLKERKELRYIDDEDRQHQLYHSYRKAIKMNLQLSFIKETKPAKNYDIGNKQGHFRDASTKIIKEIKLLDEYEKMKSTFIRPT